MTKQMIPGIPDDIARKFLADVRKLLSEGGWIQGSSAVDANGHEVPFNSEAACKWCLTGAIAKVSKNYDSKIDNYPGDYVDLQLDIARFMDDINGIQARALDDMGYIPGFVFYNSPLSVWNDVGNRKKQEVLNVIDKTIEALA